MKKSIGIIFILIGSSWLSISCKNLTAEERFANYINNERNHIKYKESMNGTEVIVKYISMEQQKLISKHNDASDSNQRYSDNIYFDIRISKSDLKTDKARNLYLNFDIQNDFQLDVNHSFLAPLICQKIENGIKTEYEYLIVFDSPALEISSAEKVDLVYTDKIFSTGQRKYTFKKQDILKIPKLSEK